VGRRVETRVLPRSHVFSVSTVQCSKSPSSVVKECRVTREFVFPLKSRNYKVSATVGVTTVVARPIRAILDTGAGPNLVRAELLPQDWERYRVTSDPRREIVGSGGRRLKQLGVVVLHVELGRLRVRCRFTVVPGLVAECILGCQFLDRHVTEILPKEKKIRLNDGTIVHILQDSGDVPPSTSVEAQNPSVIPRRSEWRVG
jgi:gag-polyprotein putative aspartyl protease